MTGRRPSWLRESVVKRVASTLFTICMAVWFAYGTPVHVSQPQQHLHLHESLDSLSEQAAVLQLLSHRHTPDLPTLSAISFLPALTPSIAVVVLVLVGGAGVAVVQRVLNGHHLSPTHGPPRRPSF